MDGAILLFIQEYIRCDLLDPIMVFITHTGDYGVLCIGIALVLLLVPKTRRFGNIVAASLLIEFIVTNGIIKNAVARTRPYYVIDELILMIEEQPDFSFPSGHAGITFAFAGAFLFSLMFGLKGFSDSRKFKIATVVVMIYAVLLAFSRLYVGVHYPTDVLAGTAIGLGTALTAYFLEGKIRPWFIERKAKKASKAGGTASSAE